ncbi:OmpA family protein [Porphyromonas endodontalis]|jgi:outer membrane protein 40|uniref:OmpA family protein n=1 Tax=Porphyromonas endodontalis TaxID=28124 RepID=UPI0028EFD360|nr:OmpA family protein [Porphyromonas endodontalis]
MKAKVLMLALMGSFALSLGAQAQQEVATPNKSGHKTVFNRDRGCDHWFLEIQGGVGILPFGEANNKASLTDRIYPIVQLGLGQWHEPWFATRVQLGGWNMKGFVMDAAGTNQAYNNLFAVAHYDFMFDVVNYFAKYNAKRVFHLVPYVGLGAGYKHHTTTGGAFGDVFDATKRVAGATTNDFGGVVDAGVIFKFRLGRRVDLNLEAQMLATKTNMMGTSWKKQGADLMAFATAGLGFNLGKPEWDVLTPMDWALVNDLNGQINNLRAENAELAKRPAYCPECPEVEPSQTTEVKTVVSNVVYFRIASAKIDQNQYINIYNTARYALENNSKIYVVGYADEATGNASINMTLSERRAKAVAKALVEKYGVSEDMIEVDFKGDTVQPYETNEWNRVVIMTAE